MYRGNPFLIEVGLAYGGVSAAQKVSLEALTEMLGETDARTLRQFLMNTFDGVGSDAADKIMTEAQMGTRQSPGKLSKDEAPEQMKAFFDLADADKDGFVTPSELAAGMKAMGGGGERGGERGGPPRHGETSVQPAEKAAGAAQ